MRGQQRTGQQAAAAQRNEQGIQPAHVFQQFLYRGALSGNDVGMIEGWNQGQALLLDQVARHLFAILGQAVIADHACSVAQRSGFFGCRRIVGHDDGGGNAQQLRSQGDGLGMIARRERDHARLALGRRQVGHRVVAAAKLEGPDALEILALEEHLGAKPRIDGLRSQHRAAVGRCTQGGAGLDDILVGG